MWCVYILECFDGSLYTGITNDLQKRIDCHNAGKGAKYTRTRLPVKLRIFFDVESKSAAAKLEHKIKRLSRQEKLDLVKIP
jgi:putative endonuclease